MLDPTHLPPLQNHLIAHLPEPQRERLLALCEPVRLELGQVLCEAGGPLQHAYFPLQAFISMVVGVDTHPSLEVGLIGREGMLGATLLLGVSRVPVRALVLGPGSAWRVSRASFVRELGRNPLLREMLGRFVYVRLAQMAASAACLRFHLIEPRLARWLLMCQDRADADHFHITQEVLAGMLGVRRVGITGAAGALQRAGLIRYHRGELTVLDRPGLQVRACSCYAAENRAYRDQLH